MAPKILRTLSLGYLGKALLKEAVGIRTALEQQNALLTRLADQFAPQQGEPVREAEASVDFIDAQEAALVEEYIDKVHRELHREPSEDEIIRFLAEEKTAELHTAMSWEDQQAALRRLGRL